ncbi:MAG: guanylate kinase [Syntrophomonadaceae bacterium]|jgi:guanylate kinase
MTRKGLLFIISGPSGVGKGTIKAELLAQFKDIKASISATTRKPRIGEIDGQDYFYVSEEAFEQMIAQGKLLEWANVYSNKYGTPKDFVWENLHNGNDVLLEIDIQGAFQVKKNIPDGIFIFIYPPNAAEIAHRLIQRGKDSKESINLRIAACEEELKQAKYYDYIVVNDDLEQAVQKVSAIITAERCKVKNLYLG